MAKAQHLPLGQALREYAGAANKERLLSLLVPVQRAAEACPWLKAMVDAGEIFHPLRWSPGEALQLLKDVPQLESAGVVVRMPAAWRGNRPPRPRVTGTVGGKPPSGIGKDALLDFQMEVTLDGETLTAAEIRELLAKSDGLALVRGRWIELDPKHLKQAIDRFREAERAAGENGLAFGEAMRLVAGADVAPDVTCLRKMRAGRRWWRAHGWRKRSKRCGVPQGLDGVDPGDGVEGHVAAVSASGRAMASSADQTRPRGMPRGRHGARQNNPGACACYCCSNARLARNRSLHHEAEPADRSRFSAGQLGIGDRAIRAGSEDSDRASIRRPGGDLKALGPIDLRGVDLVITTYGYLLRAPWIAEASWRLVVLDEAQAIKNPGAKQTRAVKNLKPDARMALTGTPVENRLGDLWSLFDFINPGLLGSAKEFTKFTKRLAESPQASYGPLRELVKPYILRRLKTDKSVISDLPDKTEMKAFCPLTRSQAALYEQAVKELAEQLARQQCTPGSSAKGWFFRI